ncbi:hypothetical protein TMEN_5795 [Trichophyton mentagrophytes]|uniref:N-acetyltransferase domain-containing protein n=1 Tax=Trichophyton interdigitale (strain MR816) TaxID=1215338 RepID=A0A059J686_TRIIM|nr:hypothetical protein H101_05057 [Trichophyton interdigitale H6]KDB23396.1 hypothetical protein H109_04722 [Trichophyton interdigitale MR816]GBF63173.1 hypothetical protein TMEN_5795 [Trichophyton mentagrophytes]
MASHEILPCTPADTLEMARLERAAYGPEPLSLLMFGEPAPSAINARADKFAEMMGHPSSRWWKVMADDGKIAGIALWNFRTDENWIGQLDGPEKPDEYVETGKEGLPESGYAARRTFFNWLYGVRKRRMGGKPHVLLNLLAVHPDCQRRGIGGALLKHGLEEAKKLGMPVWLEASPEGFPLYKAHGFEIVEPVAWTLAEHGGTEEDGKVESWGMIKEAA